LESLFWPYLPLLAPNLRTIIRAGGGLLTNLLNEGSQPNHYPGEMNLVIRERVNRFTGASCAIIGCTNKGCFLRTRLKNIRGKLQRRGLL